MDMTDIRALAAEVEYFGIEVKPLTKKQGGSIQTVCPHMQFTWKSMVEVSQMMQPLPTSRRNRAHVYAAYLYFGFDDQRFDRTLREKMIAEGVCHCRTRAGKAKVRYALEVANEACFRLVLRGYDAEAYQCPTGRWFHVTTHPKH